MSRKSRSIPRPASSQIVRYFAVNDFGTVVNPMIVAGQLHGGVAQGIGQALMEEVSYDSSGQPITGSFMDYALPRAEDIPPMEVGDHPSPAKSNPLGTKGCGEAGCAGSLVCIVNAVVDALSEYGITHIDMPLTPERVWRAIQDAKAKAAWRSRAPTNASCHRPRKRAIQYSRDVSDEREAAAYSDSPPSRGMTTRSGARRCPLRRRLLARLVDRDVVAMRQRRLPLATTSASSSTKRWPFLS